MHNHPLHREVTVECSCCHIDCSFMFKSSSDHVICKGCLRHQGNTLPKVMQRDADHIGLWKSAFGVAKEDHFVELNRLKNLITQRDREIAALQTEVEDLHQVVRVGVEDASPLAVQQWFASDRVAQANDQRDAAYRSRDHAYRALWAADHLHHEDEWRDGYCSCGQPAAQCKELGAISPVVTTLHRWEHTQLERLYRGLDHGLPDEHPEVLKLSPRGWRRRRDTTA